MMFERFTGEARTIVIGAQEHARRLGHGYIGCEHLLLSAAAARTPAAACLAEQGVTPARIEAEIIRVIGHGQAASMFSAPEREALASIGIDIDVVQERIEAAFGPGALTAAARRGRRPTCRRSPMARLLRRGRPPAHDRQAGRATPAGHIPFTPRAKKCLERAWREAQAQRDRYLGAQHLTLALAGMRDGMVPPILSALGASPAALRTAILDRYRQAS